MTGRKCKHEGMQDTLIHMAATQATHRFGGEDDGMFSAATFAGAFADMAGTGRPGGRTVRAMLLGQPGIRRCAGGAHYRLIREVSGE